jgi:haloacetate dehalogenase
MFEGFKQSMIDTGDPQIFLDYVLDGWSGTANAFPEEVRAEYARSFRDPKTLHAICEEYRAATTLDHEHERGRSSPAADQMPRARALEPARAVAGLV